MAAKRKNAFGLNEHQELFAQAVASGALQAEAYKQAFPRSAGLSNAVVATRASELAALPLVRARINTLLAQACEKAGVVAVDVIREIARIAFSDVAKMLDATGNLKKIGDMDAATRAAIASVKWGKDGVEVKLWDKNSALEKLMKHLGQYEIDNKQRADPLATLLSELSGRIVEPKTGD